MVTSGVQDFCEGRLFALQDPQYNVLGVVTAAGVLAERYEYTLYGRRTVYRSTGLDAGFLLRCDHDNDGDVDSADLAIVTANLPTPSGATRWDGDNNADGDVDSYDQDRVNAAIAMLADNHDPRAGTAYRHSRVVPISGAPLCTIAFQGLRLDETTGLIDNRYRVYDPRLQRYLQPDPLGYPDGLNRYAAYHVLRGGVDPVGLWKIERDSNQEYATAIPDKRGDTIQSLADTIGLEVNQFKDWLTLPDYSIHVKYGEPKPLENLLPHNSLCDTVKIPNTINALWMGNMEDTHVTNFDQQVHDLRNLGFNVKASGSAAAYFGDIWLFVPGDVSIAAIREPSVQYLDTWAYLSDISAMSEKRSLHGMLIDGHGRAGHIWMADHSFKVEYIEILNSLNYRLGAVLLNVCNGGWCAADNPQEGGLNDDGWINGQLYGPPWTRGKPGDPRVVHAGGRDLVSSNGIFSGLRRGLNPFTENIDVRALFPRGAQGTK